MEAVPATLARMTDDGLALRLGTRLYGAELDGAERLDALKRMDVPPELNALSDVLIARSALLKLTDGSTSAQVNTAYGLDLHLLERYQKGFETTIQAAIRARAPEDSEHAQTFLERMINEVSGVLHEHTLDLGDEALKLEPPQRLARLQEQFRAEAEALKSEVAIWLHILAESQYVSVIERLGEDAVKYHFFRMDTERNVLDKKVSTVGDRYVGRTITTDTTTRTRVFNERRTHTLVNAENHALHDYRRKVPERIARLINDIPPEIRQFATIIDGQVTKEEVVRRTTLDKVETTSKSVFIPDPAVALFGTWALGGWGGSAVEPATATYQGHSQNKANAALGLSLLTLPVIGALAGSMTGGRGAMMVGIVGFMLILVSQLVMRLPPKPRN